MKGRNVHSRALDAGGMGLEVKHAIRGGYLGMSRDARPGVVGMLLEVRTLTLFHTLGEVALGGFDVRREGMT